MYKNRTLLWEVHCNCAYYTHCYAGCDLLRGKYENPQQIIPLAVAVIGLDIVYCTVLKLFYKQMTYTLDFMLILLLNISVIFQSCFGSIGFSFKHYITCIVALVACQLGFLLTRNHMWIQSKNDCTLHCLSRSHVKHHLFDGKPKYVDQHRLH